MSLIERGKRTASIEVVRKVAAALGVSMAELIDACENGQDHDASPVQVKVPYSGVVLDAGFYSRNREINPNSSFSVNG